MAADVKAITCRVCRSPKLCKCGCGQTVNSIGRFYARGHQVKGKTYLEIYGTETPACGFKSGDGNPNYDTILKTKSNESLKRYYKNNPDATYDKIRKGTITRSNIVLENGEHFNSNWEVEVYNILQERNITFSREVKVKLLDGGLKIVDFVVDNIYIEVVGTSYCRDPEKFTRRMYQLYNSIKGHGYLIIITSEKLRSKVSGDCPPEYDIITSTLSKTQVLRSIQLFRNIEQIKNNLNREGII
jgi:hypothetical protein